MYYWFCFIDVWVHTSCVYWSPWLCLVGDEVIGLDEAIPVGTKTVSCTNNTLLITTIHVNTYCSNFRRIVNL